MFLTSCATLHKGVVVYKGYTSVIADKKSSYVLERVFEKNEYNGIYYIRIVNKKGDTAQRFVQPLFWNKVEIGDTINLIKEKKYEK